MRRDKEKRLNALERDERAVNLSIKVPFLKALNALKQSILEAFQTGDTACIMKVCQERLTPLLMAQTEVAYLKGGRRAQLSSERVIKESTLEFAPVRFSLGDADDSTARGVADYLQKISGIDPSQFNDSFQKHNAGAIGDLSVAICDEVKKALIDLSEAGIHIKGGKSEVAKTLIANGVKATNLGALAETLFRTHTQQAYSAGRWSAVEDSDVGDYIWGFEYVTAHDPRVREGHRVLEGVRLPKEDPFWEKYFPPNGWNCRCTTLEIWKDDDDARIDFGITGRDPRTRTPEQMDITPEFVGNVGLWAKPAPMPVPEPAPVPETKPKKNTTKKEPKTKKKTVPKKSTPKKKTAPKKKIEKVDTGVLTNATGESIIKTKTVLPASKTQKSMYGFEYAKALDVRVIDTDKTSEEAMSQLVPIEDYFKTLITGKKEELKKKLHKKIVTDILSGRKDLALYIDRKGDLWEMVPTVSANCVLDATPRVYGDDWKITEEFKKYLAGLPLTKFLTVQELLDEFQKLEERPAEAFELAKNIATSGVTLWRFDKFKDELDYKKAHDDTEKRRTVAKDWKPAKTKKAAKEQLAKAGIVVEFREKLDTNEFAADVAECVGNVLKKFPEVRCDSIKWKNDKEKYVACFVQEGKVGGSKYIVLNADVLPVGRKAREAFNAEQFSVHWWTTGGKMKTLYHELGHALDASIVGRKHGNNSALRDKIRKKIREFKKQHKDNAREQFSGYGLTDAAEAFAEAFADVMENGDQAKAFSKEIVDLWRTDIRGEK